MSAPLIAIIEDDSAIRELQDMLLRDEGYQVISYAKGQDAHAFLLRTLPDVLILDLWLERADAREAILAALAHDPTTRHIPVIVCSAHSISAGELHDWPRLRGHRVIPKPFQPDVLLTCVRDLLASSLAPRVIAA
jgi:CheY-like chemotaxis protein